MRIPIVVEAPDIINVRFDIHTVKNFFDNLLREIQQLFDAHWQPFVFKFPVRSDDDAKIGRFIVQLVRVITHGQVNLC